MTRIAPFSPSPFAEDQFKKLDPSKQQKVLNERNEALKKIGATKRIETFEIIELINVFNSVKAKCRQQAAQIINATFTD